jgi:methionyl-tRNA formyltransferase
MAFVTDIVPVRMLTCPRVGTIQYHPSLLPRHRGGSAINWAIIQGETKTGVTIFWPDRGIDTGPILLQKETPIGPDDTVGSLYFNVLFPLGVEALIEAVALVKADRAPRIPQDESLATHEPLCTEERAVVDWSRPVREVYDLIRGTDPQPGAVTRWRSAKLKLYTAELAVGQRGAPGRVLAVDGPGIVVATGDGAIRVKRVQPEGGTKVSAVEFATSAGLAAGEVFGG